MSLQNRVTPFGEIIATPERGLFTGNRGIIHDPATRTLLTRRWASKAWLVCTCDYRGRRRTVMATRSWTELFFLDEATALAAGHRPCFFCRRDAAKSFRTAWARATGGAVPSAPQMDEILHAERLQGRAKRHHPAGGPYASLPDGAMVAADGKAYLLTGSRLSLWTPGGYRPMDAPVTVDGVLTPPSTLAALRAGYRPALHPSIDAFAKERSA